MIPLTRSTCCVWLTFICVSLLSAAAPCDAGPPQETPEQRDARMAWWREGRFGLFMHWGLYALPAGEWKGLEKQKDLGGEWIMYNARIPVKEYEPLARQFNPVQFNADEWVRLAEDAGMRYMVLTAKHCDGFAMFASKASRYNIFDATPFAHDPIGDLARACAERKMKLGFYYSHSWDWHEPDALGLDNAWDFPDRPKKDFAKYLREKSMPQVEEIVSQYKPAILWFDVPNDLTRAQSEEFLSIVRRHLPDCIVNDRVGNGLGDYATPEQFIPPEGIKGDFEVCMTLNDHWGFDKNDDRWKPAVIVVRNLVDIVSKGGNYLLNVGPTAQGVFPAAAGKILHEVGAWMKVNGESIYGTTAGPLRRLPWGRSTAKPGAIYLHVFDWPANGRLVVAGLKNNVSGAVCLSDAGLSHKPLEVVRLSEHDVEICLPAQPPDPMDTVIAVSIEGMPEVDPTILALAEPDTRNTFSVAAAAIHGQTAKYYGLSLEQRQYDRVGSWLQAADWLSWDFRTLGSATYDLEAVYGADPVCAGNEFIVSVDGKELPACKVVVTGGYQTFKTFPVGAVEVSGPGLHTLSVKVKTIVPNSGLFDLHAVVLTLARK